MGDGGSFAGRDAASAALFLGYGAGVSLAAVMRLLASGLGIRGVLGVGPREHMRLPSSTDFGPSDAGEQRAIGVEENV